MSDAKFNESIEALRGADDFTQFKAQMIAGIGVVMHSKKSPEVKADLIMALVETTVQGVRYAELLKVSEIYLKARKLGPVSLEDIVSVVGLSAHESAKKAHLNYENIATVMFGDEVESTIKL